MIPASPFWYMLGTNLRPARVSERVDFETFKLSKDSTFEWRYIEFCSTYPLKLNVKCGKNDWISKSPLHSDFLTGWPLVLSSRIMCPPGTKIRVMFLNHLAASRQWNNVRFCMVGFKHFKK